MRVSAYDPTGLDDDVAEYVGAPYMQARMVRESDSCEIELYTSNGSSVFFTPEEAEQAARDILALLAKG